MRTLIITLLLFILPHIVHGSTYRPEVNGQDVTATKTDATKQVEQKESGKAVKGTGRATDPIRCPAVSQTNASQELATLSSNNLEECPSEGAIKNHPGDGKGKTFQIK